MTFTDDDLKQLKENMVQRGRSEVYMQRFELEALLARLEAAEEALYYFAHCGTLGHSAGMKGDLLYEAWEKMAGK